MKTREYHWSTEIPPHGVCMVTAEVSGSDWHGDYYNPPEYRDVCIMVTNQDEEDITAKLSDELIDGLMEEAIGFEDAKIEAEMDEYYENRRDAQLDAYIRAYDDTEGRIDPEDR